MDSFVNFEILATGEHFSASRIWTRERLLSGMDSDVVDQLVLGLEWLLTAVAVMPIARVVSLFGTTHVVNSQMRDKLHHRRVPLAALGRLIGGRLLMLTMIAMCLSMIH